MAHIKTTRGVYYLAKNDASAIDVRAAVFVGSAPAAATVRDYNFLDELTAAMTEAAATNYARQDLASVTLTEVDGSDNVTLTSAAPTITDVGAGETWTTVAYYVYNASDAAATLLTVDTTAATLITNGGDVTLPALNYTFA